VHRNHETLKRRQLMLIQFGPETVIVIYRHVYS
jgi:hypothetical protein